MLALLGGAAVLAAPVRAQDGAWDAPRVLEMVELARQRRAQPYEDSALRNYSADAQGYIYFYLDREDGSEPTLVKVDQVALEVYWAYPGSTRQRIVGLRDESLLPNRMRYHLDHLTVVQNEFGDRIELGDGDEVRSVVHPVAPGAERFYHYRLADSLTLRLGGLPEPLRVYEVEVRPDDPGSPGFVGSIFLDAAASDIVRMDFTFTRSSYVDRRLDYIRISLENGLWQGRFWLPWEQRVELRRQVPELDFPAGAVIRGHMRVRDYEFNVPLPPTLFRGPTVTAVPRSQREAYAFEEELFAELAEQGLSPDPDLEALRDEAAELIGRRFLDGLPRLRLDLRGASGVLRFDRTERLHLGAGLSYRMGGGTAVLRAGGGYASGTEEPSARLGIDFDALEHPVEVGSWWNEPRDLGYPAISGLMNTFSSLAAAAGAEFGHDFRDTWFSRGFGIEARRARPLFLDWFVSGEGVVEFARTASSLVDGFDADVDHELNRPLAVIDEGMDARAQVTVGRGSAAESARGWGAEAAFGFGRFDPEDDPASSGSEGARGYGRLHLDWQGRVTGLERRWRLSARLRAGLLLGEAPVQHFFLLGGRGTVPGHGFRSFAGDRSALLDVELRRELADPWISARASAAAGWTSLADERFAEAGVDGAVGPSVGLGIGLVNEILWLDVHRGLGDGGDWEVLLSVDPRLWHVL